MSDLQELLKILRQKKQSIGFAESCTGGLLSSTFAKVPGVSDVYLGSVVSYSNSVKINLLGVLPATLQKFGAVSVETAKEMAKQATQKLQTDCAIAITGIAGPSGGTVDKPVGTVCFAVQGPDFESSERKIFAGSRVDVQQQAVEFAIKFMLNQILNA